MTNLYHIYSGKHMRAGAPRTVSIEEFISMITSSGLMNAGSFGSGEVGAIYNLSMMTYPDELTWEKHM